MQATAGLASRWIFWFQTIAALRVRPSPEVIRSWERPRWSRLGTIGDHRKVTEAGVKGLKAALPNVEVSTGWESAELMKKADDEKK